MKTHSKNRLLFAYSYWDSIPVMAGITHFFYLLLMLSLFPILPWWGNLITGLTYSMSIAWNINSVSHNFIHNAYFKSFIANRMFSLLESLTMCFSQTMYDYVHRQHHIGNNDRINPDGETVDWISIYRHGKNGEPEHAMRYSFLSFFRDDPKRIDALIRKHSQWLANFAVFEVVVSILMILALFLFNWKLGFFFVFFYYLGHSFSAMNGYYEHYGANPNKPIAWGVSCYNTLYNFFWLNNGYHAEHHYRPKHHWTQMPDLHAQIYQQQLDAKVKVIQWPHVIGFLQKR